MDSVQRDLQTWLAVMPDTDADVEALRQRIGRIGRLFERVLDQVAESAHVTRGDATTLSVLARSECPCTPTELVRTLGLTSGTVSTRLKRLTTAGLIEAVAGDGDARSRPVRLTDRGRQVWAGVTAARTSRETDLVRGALGARQVGALNDGLAPLLAALEERLGEGGVHDLPRGS